MSLPDFDPAIHKEISNVPVVRWILGAQPENDLHGWRAAGCPSNYGVSCTGGANGKDTCRYTCYKCCDDTCPGRSEKYYSGSKAGKTECGTQCYYCKDCTSGDTSYSGSYAGTSECGTCYYCSDTCRSGQKSVSCSWDEDKVRVSSTECGTGCYECQYNSDCSVTSKSCSYGCAYENSCGKCTSCEDKPADPHAQGTNHARLNT
ncbi:MAG: hypothetical protein SO314_08495 [Alphaproteobacteria bacterium]|nr:hypothetical protein [Alphaproteobacteria bacterium]